MDALMPRAHGCAGVAHPWGLGRSIPAAHGLVRDFSPLADGFRLRFTEAYLCAAIESFISLSRNKITFKLVATSVPMEIVSIEYSGQRRFGLVLLCVPRIRWLDQEMDLTQPLPLKSFFHYQHSFQAVDALP